MPAMSSMRTGCRRQARRVLASGVRYLDNFYDAYRLCVELDGRSSHPPEQKWQDADRDNDNLFAGDVQTVRFGCVTLLFVAARGLRNSPRC